MLEWITLGLVIAKYVLDFVAPRTKNKVDDKAKSVTDNLPLPSLPEALDAATKKAPAPVAKPVEGFGMARDHRAGK